MPLTPADVHNVTFKKPMLGKRGYDEDEVDGFLDEVERELARLSDENGELRAQIESLRAGAPPGAADHAEMAAALDRVQREKHAAEQQMQELEAEMHETHQQMVASQQQIQQLQQQLQQQQQRAPQGGGEGGPGQGGEQEALRLLMVAQRTADEHLEDSRKEADNMVSEAQREASAMMTEAQRESQTMVTKAQRESKTMVVEAQRESETMVTEARAQAEDLVGQARDKAERLEIEAEQERQKVMGALENKRSSLLKHIEELKTFEREYRTRLKLYLESQLRDLNGQQAAPEDEAFEQAAAEAVENERTGSKGAAARNGGFASSLPGPRG
ncbi:DivIVA domain-containing protein [Glycomyces arizonensis]|uniref:DivIVA domain-containing protein n=1 Tax=Glycomyces arizonensis TaxID=256035 RepID=UPI0003FD9192|nr:DivIVA domain-containing protein [Glycomyces arizonensis]